MLTTEAPKDRVNAAIKYAETLDWPIVPLYPMDGDSCACGDKCCTRPGQHPINDTTATTAIGEIETLWEKHPHAVPGIKLGAETGIIAHEVIYERLGFTHNAAIIAYIQKNYKGARLIMRDDTLIALYRANNLCCSSIMLAAGERALYDDHYVELPYNGTSRARWVLCDINSIREIPSIPEALLGEVRVAAAYERMRNAKKTITRDAYGDFISLFVDGLDGKVSSSREFLVTALLPAMGAAMGKRFKVKHHSTTLYPTLWTMIVGPSGLSGKSTALKLASSAITNLHMKYCDEYRNEMAEWHEDTKLARKEKRDPKDPPTPRLLMTTGNITPEALIYQLAQDDEGMLIRIDEITELFESFNKKYMTGFREALLTIKESGPLSQVRRTQEPIYVAEPFVTIAGATTPAGFERIYSKYDTNNGVLGRFLFTHTTEMVKRKPFMEGLTEDQHNLFFGVFEAIEAMTAQHELSLSDEASEHYQKQFEIQEADIIAISSADSDIAEAIAPNLTRMQDEILRIALVNEVFDAVLNGRPIPTQISLDTISRAIKLGDYYRGQVQLLSDGMASSAIEHTLQKLRLYSSRKRVVSWAALTRQCSVRHFSPRDRDSLIQQLINEGTLTEVEDAEAADQKKPLPKSSRAFKYTGE